LALVKHEGDGQRILTNPLTGWRLVRHASRLLFGGMATVGATKIVTIEPEDGRSSGSMGELSDTR